MRDTISDFVHVLKYVFIALAWFMVDTAWFMVNTVYYVQYFKLGFTFQGTQHCTGQY